MSAVTRMWTFTCAAVLAGAVTASAQQPGPSPTAPATVTSGATLDAMVADQVRADQANRQIVRDVLSRSEVREVAAKAGLDLERAKQAVSTLDGAELQEIAAHARHVEASLSGGASTVVISTTTIIIILLVVILLIVALN
jgi:predicted outer membrane protein